MMAQKASPSDQLERKSLMVTFCGDMEKSVHNVDRRSVGEYYNTVVRSLRIKDTLGPAMLSFVGRLSSSWRFKMY